MEEAAKLGFVPTKINDTFALKLSKHLPTKKCLLPQQPDRDAFTTNICDQTVIIADLHPTMRQYTIFTSADDEQRIANEYDVILVSSHNRISIIDEYTYHEAYDVSY